jgi:hydrogenase-4 membrane subunit HyfE
MKHLKKSASGGFIAYIVIAAIAIFLIAYFRTNIKDFLTSPGVKPALLMAIDWVQQGLLWVVGKLGWTSTQLK